MDYNEYINWCPKCGDSLFVAGFRASCRIPLTPSGFDPSEAKRLDTYEEIVQCSNALGANCGFRDGGFIDGGLPTGVGWHYKIKVAISKTDMPHFYLIVNAENIEHDGESGDYGIEVSKFARQIAISKFSEKMLPAVRGDKEACLEVGHLVGEYLAGLHDGNSFEVIDLVTEDGIARNLVNAAKSVDALLNMKW